MPLLGRLIQSASCINAEIVIVADGSRAYDRLDSRFTQMNSVRFYQVESKGYIESVLDEAIEFTTSDYILRIDDDESLSPQLLKWLHCHHYLSHDNWTFPRAHLWEGESHYIANSPLWPDYQTRLSIRTKSAGREKIHAASPYGSGEIAPYPILHHKFLVRPTTDRKCILDRYERMQEGAGSGFVPFSLPESMGELDIRPIADLPQ